MVFTFFHNRSRFPNSPRQFFFSFDTIKLVAFPSRSRFAKSRAICDVGMLFTNLCGPCGPRLKLAELQSRIQSFRLERLPP
jgi:hypothetical protein